MSTEKKAAPAKTSAKAKAKSQESKKEWTPIPRKATFTVEKEKGQRIFHPVNKRAHKWAKKVGKRTRLTVVDMKKIHVTKRVKLYVYDATGVLKAVKF